MDKSENTCQCQHKLAQQLKLTFGHLLPKLISHHTHQKKFWIENKHQVPSTSTFGLDAFAVGWNDDALDLPEFKVLQDLSEPHDDAPLHAGLHWVLLVQAVLETNQLLQQVRHTLVNVFAQHLVAIADRCTHGGQSDNWQRLQLVTEYIVSHYDFTVLLSELSAVDFGAVCWAGNR